MNRKRILPMLFCCGLAALTATACGNTKKKNLADSAEFAVKVIYSVDGEVTAELPDGLHYDYVSVEGGEDINAEWDISAWELITEEAESGTYTCTVNFTATSAAFKMNNAGYNSLQAAFDAAPSRAVVIDCLEDFEGHGITSADSNITLNLNGHTISGDGSDTIVNRGTLHIVGDGTLTGVVDGEYTKTIANYGTLSLKDLTITNATGSTTIWNSHNSYSIMDITNCSITHELADSNVIINSGIMNLHSGVIYSSASEGFSLVKINEDNAVLNYYDGSFSCTGDGFTVTRLAGTFNNYSDHDIIGGNQLGDAAAAHSADDNN